MVDVSKYIEAKSDQLNADDLLGEQSRVIRITRVVETGDKEQPLAIHYDGDRGKPYKPGKSMRRVLVGLWGSEGEAYVGRSLELYRDPEVEFGKLKVGGIRISRMSDLDGDKSLALAVRRGTKAMFDVKPLRQDRPPAAANGNGRPSMTPEQKVDAYVSNVGKIDSLDVLAEYQGHEQRRKFVDALARSNPDLHKRIADANEAAFKRLSPAEAQPAGDGFDDDLGFPDDPGLSNPGGDQ